MKRSSLHRWECSNWEEIEHLQMTLNSRKSSQSSSEEGSFHACLQQQLQSLLLGLVSTSSTEILSFLKAKSLDLIQGLQWQLKWKLSVSCGCIISFVKDPALKYWYVTLIITLDLLESISYIQISLLSRDFAFV